jgi:hypothetical protein
MSQLLEKQLRRILLDSFKAGEQNIINDDILEAYEISMVAPKIEKYRLEVMEHQKNLSRIIYEQYLEKLIKDTTNQIFQERPSLP